MNYELFAFTIMIFTIGYGFHSYEFYRLKKCNELRLEYVINYTYLTIYAVGMFLLFTNGLLWILN